uniref:Uncharacterized protein n=1 Tax=Ficedula albicollis TaxID=59894 RepID=A0A803VLN8_FICAL
MELSALPQASLPQQDPRGGDWPLCTWEPKICPRAAPTGLSRVWGGEEGEQLHPPWLTPGSLLGEHKVRPDPPGPSGSPGGLWRAEQWGLHPGPDRLGGEGGLLLPVQDTRDPGARRAGGDHRRQRLRQRQLLHRDDPGQLPAHGRHPRALPAGQGRVHDQALPGAARAPLGRHLHSCQRHQHSHLRDAAAPLDLLCGVWFLWGVVCVGVVSVGCGSAVPAPPPSLQVHDQALPGAARAPLGRHLHSCQRHQHSHLRDAAAPLDLLVAAKGCGGSRASCWMPGFAPRTRFEERIPPCSRDPAAFGHREILLLALVCDQGKHQCQGEPAAWHRAVTVWEGGEGPEQASTPRDTSDLVLLIWRDAGMGESDAGLVCTSRAHLMSVYFCLS